MLELAETRSLYFDRFLLELEQRIIKFHQINIDTELMIDWDACLRLTKNGYFFDHWFD